MGVLSRVAATNDTAMALLPLLERPPWVRRTPKGKWEKHIDGKWRGVEAADRLRLTQQDAQARCAVLGFGRAGGGVRAAAAPHLLCVAIALAPEPPNTPKPCTKPYKTQTPNPEP